MTTYCLPEPPETGSVWDRHGSRWVLDRVEKMWRCDNPPNVMSWEALLSVFGPASDVRPVGQWAEGEHVLHKDDEHTLPVGALVRANDNMIGQFDGNGTYFVPGDSASWTGWDLGYPLRVIYVPPTDCEEE